MIPPLHRLTLPSPPGARRADEVAFIIAGTLLAQVAASIASARLMRGLEWDSGEKITSVLLAEMAGLVWLGIALPWRRPEGWRELGLAWPGGRWLRLSLVGAMASLVLGVALKLLFEPLLGAGQGLLDELLPLDGELEALSVLAFLFAAGGLAPVVEEVLFRGLVYRWLRQYLRIWPAALLAALPHALLHFDLSSLPSFLAIFVLAALLYEASGCLWCPIILHAGHNILSLALALLLYPADLE